MSTNINLLLLKEEELSRKKKKIKILNNIAFGALLGVGLLSVSIFLISQFIVSSSIQKNQKEMEELIAKYQYQQASLYVLNDRVESILKILKTRKDLSKVASTLLAKVPNNFSIENFEVDNKSVIFTGQSKSLFAIGKFIDDLTNMVREKESIKSLVLNSLALDVGKNIYRVSLKSEL